jgi:serine phosphatase RsbU (regulator of sigma subunit)
VSESAAARLASLTLSAALDALPSGVAIFDAHGTVCYLNPVGAQLLERPVTELVGRSIWTAVPELAGSTFAGFLLDARNGGTPVTWRGRLTPAGPRLTATAVVVDHLLQVSFQETTDQQPEGPSDVAGSDADAERERLRFLAEVSETMIATLNTGESAAKLAELAVSRLCDWSVVSLLGEDGGPGDLAWAHRDPARRSDVKTYLLGRLHDTGDDVAVVDALRSGQPVQVIPRHELVAPSLPNEEVREAWRRLDATSTTIVPLRARGETFGALVLINAGGRPALTESGIATAVEAARRGALALDNARLYGRQLKVAETLQHSLLTPPPQLDHAQIAVRYRPATAYQQVGGDWYDAFAQPDGGALLVIGDVVGHNVDAAAAMGQIRSILRGIAYDRPETPAQILGRVDRILTGLQIDTVATALVARLDPPAEPDGSGRRVLCWSSAGHLPPLLLHRDGSVRSLTSPPERLLGTRWTRPRTNHEVLLDPDDTVVFYTDGLVEHGRTGIDEGIARLTAQLATLAETDLDALCDLLLEQIVSGRTDDDIAILVVRCTQEESRSHASAPKPRSEAAVARPAPRVAARSGGTSRSS